MRNIINYKEQISTLNPLDNSKFYYNPPIWKLLDKHWKERLSPFENKEISRKDIIECYKNYFEKRDSDFIHPFLLTMVWGFAKNGYGAYRTNKYLQIENHENIQNALTNVEKGNIKGAFDSLMKIDGLSISYVSKVLYFATRGASIKNYTLIFDIRVARALVEIEAGSYIASIVSVNPSNKYIHYDKYNNLLHETAKKIDTEAECLEMFLFEFGGK